MLFETIRCENGVTQNIALHEDRVERSIGKRLDLSFLTPPSDGVYRCKLIYDKEIISAEYLPYVRQKIKTLKIVESDIDYGLKYLDRGAIERLCTQKSDKEDILIVKNGLLTDTSIANIALSKNGVWLTPKNPLLKGTMRQRLLNDGFLQEADISVKEIFDFEVVAVMNALRGFEPLGNTKDVIRF